MSFNKNVEKIMSRPNEPSHVNGFEGEEIEDPHADLVLAEAGLSRSDQFSPLFPRHRVIAAKLIEYMISLKSLDELEKVAIFGRDNINPNLFIYAFMVTVLNRSDTKDALILTLPEVFPDRFFPSAIFRGADEQLHAVPEGSRKSIPVDLIKTSTAKYEEARMDYFREDFGLNSTYFNWHLLHPFQVTDKSIASIDRRGELWCYYHQQILAHYNNERYCNALLDIRPLYDLYGGITEGYFPKLCTQYATNSWPTRQERTEIHDLNRPEEWLLIDRAHFQLWVDRLSNAIELGRIEGDDGKTIELNNDAGIDVLGNILQSSVLSPNRKFYGDISNMGHALIAYSHDPENENRQSYGVMGEPATCLRDTAFYRWYANILRIVNLHKRQLPPYTDGDLGFDGVKINSLNVEYQDSKDGSNKNEFKTFLTDSEFNLENGLSYKPKGSVFARIKHLQHAKFRYVFDIKNSGSKAQFGTIRIFLCHKFDTQGHELPLPRLRSSFIELDRFTVNLTPGSNSIKRNSDDSSVVVPDQSIFQPDVIRQKIISKASDAPPYCLSGWPSYLLIPKGFRLGASYVIFAMVSNGANDKVDDTTPDSNDKCGRASSFCGLKNRKYPDKRSMGFPFDRPVPQDKLTLDEFTSPHSNMIAVDVKIKFNDEEKQ